MKYTEINNIRMFLNIRINQTKTEQKSKQNSRYYRLFNSDYCFI